MLAALLCAALGVQDEERLRVDEADENFMRHWASALEEGDGQRLKSLLEEAHRKNAGKLFRLRTEDPLWVSLPRALAPRFMALPEKLRRPWEESAAGELGIGGDEPRRRVLAETYAATPAGRDAIEALANEDFDRGELLGAVRSWTRLLDDAATPALALKLAQAHALRGDAKAVAALAARAKAERWIGDVTVGSRRLSVADALAALRCADPPVESAAAGSPPTAELSLGRLELKTEGNGYGGRQHAAMLPAVAEIDGRPLVFFTNGIKVLAIDPARAAGGPLEPAVVWRHPKDGAIRYGLPWSHSQGTSRPPAGAVVDGLRVYVNVFTQLAREPQKMRRNQDAFEGPSAIRALDARTGELIWDTDALETSDSEGEPIKRVAQLFDRRYVCFCGPPIVRGERIYVPAMSSPRSGRECFVACFRTSDGEPLWKTSVAAFATSQDVISITALAEEGGTLAVASNFGVVAALDAATGRVEWLRSYLEQADRPGGRPLPSAPVISGSTVYVLAQDATTPLAFDRWNGRALPWPEVAVAWEDVDVLAGRVGDWLVFTGRQSCALRMSDGKLANLGLEDAPGVGRPALAGGRLFAPSKTSLKIFETSTWKLEDTRPWAAGGQGGNVAVGAGFCAVLGDKLDLCTSERLLAGEGPDALLRRAGALETTGRVPESILLLEKAERLLEGDPAAVERRSGLRERIQKLREAPEEKKE